jgi:fructoselysine-6-P-deglycase FrlB-like protein
MVTRVYGNAGLYFVEFTKTPEGLWTAAVPFVESCEYVIDLYAEDEAGNISYYATYLLTFDASKLRIYADSNKNGTALTAFKCKKG